MLNEVQRGELVESDLDRFIERRVALVHEDRPGQERANALQALWRASEERQAATAKRLKAIEEEGEARYERTDALRCIENREGYAKSISREIARLKREG